MDKAERQINLLLLLLSTSRPLTAAQIRDKIPAYQGQQDDTFHRMFERDKVDLRELGFAVEIEDADGWGVETGYRIKAHEVQLDDLGLTPDEQAALSLAAYAWESGRGATDASLGVLKLAAVSGDAGSEPTGWALPRVSMDKDVASLMDAVARRKQVRFVYRAGGGGEPQERLVDPYGLIHRGGGWYLAGFDHARGDVRHFKLARVDGSMSIASGDDPDFEPPERMDLRITSGPWEGESLTHVRVAFAPESVWWVERRTGAERVGERNDGWVELRLAASDITSFASWVAGFGDQAVALDPPELRDAVIARLRAMAGGR